MKNTLTLPQTWCQPSFSSRLHPERRRGVRAAQSLSACKHYMALTHTLFCTEKGAGNHLDTFTGMEHLETRMKAV